VIRVLDSFIADKIAAGEVIERPVSAVKELVENSIDAGASSIIVEIRGGGKSYIRVTDDGCGIPTDEAETAFLRHATSKISSITDLDAIGSLGFRGEALASISAVSRLTLVTKTAEANSGLKLVLHGGRVISNEKTGANQGTTIIAEDLFYNTPARRKFMKSDAREASAIIELIQQFAVYYAGIRFMMINNGQTVFTTKGDGDVLAVLDTLYPEMHAYKLIAVDGDGVRGYVSDPGSTRTSRKGQLFFVNGRLVDSAVIERGLNEGYGGRIFSGFPSAVLFIDSDPHDIDVNIHPGKREIRFLRQDEVRESIREAVNRSVMTDRGVPEAIVRKPEPPEVSVHAGSEIAEAVVKPSAAVETASEQTSIRDFLSRLDRDTDRKVPQDEPAVRYPEHVAEEAAEYTAVSSATVSVSGPDIPKPFDFDELVFKGYVFDTYIIMQGRDTLYIFDQHAAHERIFYEKFMAGYKESSHIPQPILTPFTLNVSADVYLTGRDRLDALRNMGYDIEDFGDRCFIVRGIPEYMNAAEADGFVRGFMDDASDVQGDNQAVIDKLIMRSCKSAVKANDRLSEREIHELMTGLSACENPYSCPHGRPTFIKVSSYDIERSFRRR
jgi:DNA mismatch repair protein MutL